MNFLTPRIGLFVGNDLSTSILLKRLIPDLQHLGWRVKVFLPQNKPPAPTADYRLQEFYLYERLLLADAQAILDQLPISHRANCYSYNALAKVFDVQIERVSNINDASFVEKIGNDIDAVLSVRCLQIFKPPFINLFQGKGRFIRNLHSGALPECKGAMPIFWTMKNDKPQVTLSLHEIVPGIDEGVVLVEDNFTCPTEKSLLEVSCDSIDYAGPLLKKSLDSKDADKFAPISPRSSSSNYYSYPKPHDIDLFFKAGKKMVPQDPMNFIINQLSGGEPELNNALQKGLTKK